jgi:hypothetical protein
MKNWCNRKVNQTYHNYPTKFNAVGSVACV